ncbi:hypothetical protein IWQ61_002127 [Dispira simplex]|nr:hypothetical protein IWQ61_002127 [Dispira simplex]
MPRDITSHQGLTQPFPRGSNSTEPIKKKRQTQACEYCRQKKIKCNSSRPTCDNCKKRGLTCQYSNQNGKRIQRQGLFENLEKRLENMERLIEPLKPNECSPVKRRKISDAPMSGGSGTTVMKFDPAQTPSSAPVPVSAPAVSRPATTPFSPSTTTSSGRVLPPIHTKSPIYKGDDARQHPDHPSGLSHYPPLGQDHHSRSSAVYFGHTGSDKNCVGTTIMSSSSLPTPGGTRLPSAGSPTTDTHRKSFSGSSLTNQNTILPSMCYEGGTTSRLHIETGRYTSDTRRSGVGDGSGGPFLVTPTILPPLDLATPHSPLRHPMFPNQKHRAPSLTTVSMARDKLKSPHSATGKDLFQDGPTTGWYDRTPTSARDSTSSSPPSFSLTPAEVFAVRYFSTHLYPLHPVIHLPTVWQQIYTGQLYRPLLYSMCCLVFYSIRRQSNHPYTAKRTELVDVYAGRLSEFMVKLCAYPSVASMQTLYLFGVFEYGRGELALGRTLLSMAVQTGRALQVIRRSHKHKGEDIRSTLAIQNPSDGGMNKGLSMPPGPSATPYEEHIQMECLRRTWWQLVFMDGIESLLFRQLPRLTEDENWRVALPCDSHTWAQSIHSVPCETDQVVRVLVSNHGYEHSLDHYLLKLGTIMTHIARFKTILHQGDLCEGTVMMHPEYQAINALLLGWEADLERVWSGQKGSDGEDNHRYHSLAKFIAQLYYYSTGIVFHRMVCEYLTCPVPRPLPPLIAIDSQSVPSITMDWYTLQVVPQTLKPAANVAWSHCLELAACMAECLHQHQSELSPGEDHPLLGFAVWQSIAVLIQQRARASHPKELTALRHDIALHYNYLHLYSQVWYDDLYEQVRRWDRRIDSESVSNDYHHTTVAYPQDIVIRSSPEKHHSSSPASYCLVAATPAHSLAPESSHGSQSQTQTEACAQNTSLAHANGALSSYSLSPRVTDIATATTVTSTVTTSPTTLVTSDAPSSTLSAPSIWNTMGTRSPK